MNLGRHKRNIEINSQTYLLLREQYEMARLTAQKDVPIVRILDMPSLPTLKSSPRRTIIIILSGMVAFILSFGFIIGFLGQLGDLVESMFKRSGDVKDTGNFFPGHGGVYYRIDSLLFAAPFLYYYIVIFIR